MQAPNTVCRLCGKAAEKQGHLIQCERVINIAQQVMQPCLLELKRPPQCDKLLIGFGVVRDGGRMVMAPRGLLFLQRMMWQAVLHHFYSVDMDNIPFDDMRVINEAKGRIRLRLRAYKERVNQEARAARELGRRPLSARKAADAAFPLLDTTTGEEYDEVMLKPSIMIGCAWGSVPCCSWRGRRRAGTARRLAAAGRAQDRERSLTWYGPLLA